MSSQLQQTLQSDPLTLDKMLAQELNSLSFDDREALSEQLHGVRSLAPQECDQMIRTAVTQFHTELNTRLVSTIELLRPPTRTGTSSSAASSTAAAAAATPGLSERVPVLPDGTNPSSSSISPVSTNKQVKSQYLMDILETPYSIPDNAITSTAASVMNTATNHTDTAIPTSAATTHASNHTNTNTGTGTNDHPRYAYVRSYNFIIKFIRCELYDITKAVTRYLLCLDFLVDYFGLFALTRPLTLSSTSTYSDFTKEEQNLIRMGQFQLMPTRDRSGRRISVFLDSYGVDYTHTNRFKLCMYVIGQVASDDVCTQKNGLVNIYSQLNSDCLQIRYMIGLAVQQTECQRFMDAIPLRYSANHIFVQDDVTRGMVLNMIGKQTRLITRVHTVSGITELEYLLRCFGIPTDVFPVTNTGKVKKKNLFKWIRQRTSIEEQQLLHYGSSYNNIDSERYGIECPDLDSVLIRNGGCAWDHPANVKFRNIIERREHERDQHTTRNAKAQFLHSIILEIRSNGLRFLAYNEDQELYQEITDQTTLRTKVFQALRDQSARRKKRRLKCNTNNTTLTTTTTTTADISHDSSTSLFVGMDNRGSGNGCLLPSFEFKKQKL